MWISSNTPTQKPSLFVSKTFWTSKFLRQQHLAYPAVAVFQASHVIEAMHAAGNIMTAVQLLANENMLFYLQRYAVGKLIMSWNENNTLFVSHNPNYRKFISRTVPPWTFGTGTSSDSESHSCCTYTGPFPIVTIFIVTSIAMYISVQARSIN